MEEAGFPREPVRTLLNEQATLREMKRALGDFLSSRVDKDDLVLLLTANPVRGSLQAG